jgi:trimethylamine:corrinoid methyltransferase-like protein
MPDLHVTPSLHCILNHRQILQLHEYTLHLLETVGCSVRCIEAQDLLGHAGCDVSDPGRVKISRS